MTGKKELRLALGMRGGVSLAIWIGGACAEIDRLRKANADDDIEFWPELLAVSDYDSVIVDVIAGASAGGLNGVLYAASQQYGFDLDLVRETWLRVAGLAELTRSETPDLSVLDGDRKFLDVLDSELARLVGASTPPADRPRLDVQLSATLVTPIDRPAPGTADERLHDVRYMSRFHFAHEPRSCEWTGTDFPTDDTGGVVAKLALAGRATSSFPAAFEPAVVRSSRPATYLDTAAPTSAGRYVDMRGVFADARGAARTHDALSDDDFIVADGGILDNIPLGKALTAVANATASRPTKRYLVYLHPTGPGEEPEEPKPLVPAPSAGAVEYARRSALGVLTGAFGSRMQAETTLGDIAQMEALNRDGQLAGRMRKATLRPVLDDGQSMVDLATSTLGRYELERSLGDARAVGTLLQDPLGAIGTDVFPRTIAHCNGPVLIEDDCWRAPIARWSPERREALEPGLLESFTDRLPGPADSGGIEKVFEAGTGPLERLVRLMIEWARHLDQPATASDDQDGPGALRQRLYDVAAFVRLALAETRDLAWVTCAAADPTGVTWTPPPVTRVDSLLHVDPKLAEEVCAELSGHPAVDARSRLRTAMRERLHELVVLDPEGALAGTVDIRRKIVDDVLVPIARRLVSVTVAEEDDTPGGLLHRALASARGDLESGGQPARSVLAALEVLCYQEFLTGRPGGSIDFVRMSAANRTPLNDRFDGLVELDDDGNKLRLTAARKLAGNELMNFAAFAKADWRANDWMWGRLDATATLVDLLVTPESVGRIVGSSGGDPDPGLGRIEELVCDRAASDQWKQHFETQVWTDARVTAITSALTSYRERTSEGGGAHADEIREAARALADEIRDAILARRHWEILSDELGRAPWSESGAPLGPEATIDAVQKHSVGLDTFRTAPVEAHVAMFKSLSDAAGRAVTQTVHTTMHPGTADQKPGGVARWSGRTVRFGGRVATEALLRPKRLIVETAIGGALVVGGVVLLIVLG